MQAMRVMQAMAASHASPASYCCKSCKPTWQAVRVNMQAMQVDMRITQLLKANRFKMGI